MTYDFYAKIWDEKKEILENTMKRIKNRKRSIEIRNAKKFLPDFFLKHFSPNWYSKIKNISLFAKYYGDRAEKNLLKIGYDEYVLDYLKERSDINKMDNQWILDRDDKSTIFGLIFNPCMEIPSRYSFSLHVKFTFQKPYISKDDEEFYIHDNPVSKEKVFKVPYIRASSWKGNLRWSAMKNLIDEISGVAEKNKKWEIALTERARIVRIFGNEKEYRENDLFEEIFPEKIQEKSSEVSKFNQSFLEYIISHNYVSKDGNGKGRLLCYPTFLNRIGLDVINPHDRETRTGKNPITFEVVPCGTEGELFLLYVPFDKIGNDENEVKEEIKEDLLCICKAVKALLTEYGISAKRTSGYGTARIGRIEFKSMSLREFEKYEDLDSLLDELNDRSWNIAAISHRGDIQ